MNQRNALAAIVLGAIFAAVTCAQVAPLSEAQDRADQYWNTKISYCGDQKWYAGYDDGQISQIRGASLSVNPSPVSQTEQMNGVQWQGFTEMRGTQIRYFLPRGGGWQEWQPGLGIGSFSVHMVKKNGRWVVTPNLSSPLDRMFALPCTRVPPEKTVTEANAQRNQVEAAACNFFLDGRIDARDFLERGGRPNTCRDAAGRTVLMLTIERRNMGFDLVPLLDAGADVNAKDGKGWTALNYVRSLIEAAGPGGADQFQGTVQRLEARGAVRGVPRP